jgi:hypothetical protein
MIGQILPNNNEICYNNFSPTFREVNTPFVVLSSLLLNQLSQQLSLSTILLDPE